MKGRKEKTGRRDVESEGGMMKKEEVGKLSPSLPLPSSLSPSQLECRYITTSLLSPRALAGGNMSCVLDNMSNRYTRYVAMCTCISVCIDV